jgi:hypothetical protein
MELMINRFYNNLQILSLYIFNHPLVQLLKEQPTRRNMSALTFEANKLPTFLTKLDEKVAEKGYLRPIPNPNMPGLAHQKFPIKRT